MRLATFLTATALVLCALAEYLRVKNSPKLVYKYVNRDLDACNSAPQSPYALYKESLEDGGTRDMLRGMPNIF